MIRSRARTLVGSLALVACALAVLASCSVGSGTGSLRGSVSIADCNGTGWTEDPVDLLPDFFSADYVEDPGTPGMLRRLLTIRMQHGSFREGDSNGMAVLVRDVNQIARESIGVPITVSSDPAAPVELTLYLNERCLSGFPRDFVRVPVVLGAVSGTITFDAVYAPDLSDTGFELAAHFEDVRFEDDIRPDVRFAVMSGYFSFLYQRGRPAQRFP